MLDTMPCGVNVMTLDTLNRVRDNARRLLAELRQCDTLTMPGAHLSLLAAIEHTESALNTLRVAALVENNRLLGLAERMGV